MTARTRRGSNAFEHRPANAHWIVSETVKVNGRIVSPGVEVKVSGEPGRFVFLRHVLNPANNAEWIDVVGGPKGVERTRAFRPHRIVTVHRTRKARPK